MLLVLLAVMSLLAGAAAHATTPQFLAASAVIAGWLLAFGVREQLARAKQH
jgi:hypothetical protein